MGRTGGVAAKPYGKRTVVKHWNDWLESVPRKPLKTWCWINKVYFGNMVDGMRHHLPGELERHKDAVGPIPEKSCEVCTISFVPNTALAKYCSDACRLEGWKKNKKVSSPDGTQNSAR